MRGCGAVMWNEVSSVGRKRHARLLMTTSVAGLMMANLAAAQEAPSIQLEHDRH